MFPAISDHSDWHSVLQIVSECPEDERRKFSWIWPTQECLECLKRNLRKSGISNILSIGCGSGLFEWILQESCGVKVSGLELDKSWWTSPYAPATFIPLSFTESPITSNFLMRCASSDKFTPLFVYFNNGEAFWEYLECFHGDFVMIAGPRNGTGIHTDPTPDALLPEYSPRQRFWILKRTIDVGDAINIISIYERDTQII